jgi:hypothetical protein
MAREFKWAIRLALSLTLALALALAPRRAAPRVVLCGVPHPTAAKDKEMIGVEGANHGLMPRRPE